MPKIGLSILPLQVRYGDREALTIAKEIDADAVDFGLEDFGGRYDDRNPRSVYALPDAEFRAYFTDLKAHADSLGLTISQTHGRGRGFLNIPEEDDALVRNARLDCLATALLGAPVCVIHAVSTAFHPNAEPAFMRALNREMFARILPYARECGIRVATETFGDTLGGTCIDFFGDLDEFIAALEQTRADGFGPDCFTVCMDTGHTNKATRFHGNPSVPEAIRRLGGEITVLHLNDNTTMSDQHLLPFVGKSGCPVDGTIDWEETVRALREIGYDGVYNMELHLPRYGEEIMPEFCRFAVTVLRNFLEKTE